MRPDYSSEQLTLLAFAGAVATRVRFINRGHVPAAESAQSVYLLTDAIHNFAGLAGAMARDNYAGAAFLANMMAGQFADPAYAPVLAHVDSTPEAIAALRQIHAKAEVAAGEAA